MDRSCFHCGLDLGASEIVLKDKPFCCEGCRTVFSILTDNNLDDYYSLNEHPGQSPESSSVKNKYAYLDEKAVQAQLLDFQNEGISKITLFIPAIHCSSCIWILESLSKLDSGIKDSRSNFLKKQVLITYDENKTSLRNIVELLSSLGYEPEINFEKAVKGAGDKAQKKLIAQTGIAGFALGNIMLLSLPEYLSGSALDAQYARIFGYLNIVLSLPVMFYSATGYFKSAFGGLKHRRINIDVPIVLGIIALYSRSLYEILFQAGPGYIDSFAGFIFFLLLGKVFQEKTYQSLSFERDFKSYFPVAVTKMENFQEKIVPLSELQKGDRILVKHNELIPADGILINGDGVIDYSFVTGESVPVTRKSGEKLFSGGKQTGGSITVEIINDVSQSYLTRLWNEDVFSKGERPYLDNIANSISKYFTAVVLIIASSTGIYWYLNAPEIAVNAFTSVLIIACPCALALSVPFTLGNTMRIFGRKGFFIKNTHVIERLADITTVIFDKTGTLTESTETKIVFERANDVKELNKKQLSAIRSLCHESGHPLSRLLTDYLTEYDLMPVHEFQELQGKGLKGRVNGIELSLGSMDFIQTDRKTAGTHVAVNIDGKYSGVFKFSNIYRKGTNEMISDLSKKYSLWLMSGDNEKERETLSQIFKNPDHILFNQSSYDKMNRVKELKAKGERVLMTGDGLNDAGALRASDVGISVSENINSFSPACDGILESGNVTRLAKFVQFSQKSMNIIKISFGISITYNLVGMMFAVQGLLSPLVSAILMPVSSITIVTFATIATNYLGRKY